MLYDQHTVCPSADSSALVRGGQNRPGPDAQTSTVAPQPRWRPSSRLCADVDQKSGQR